MKINKKDFDIETERQLSALEQVASAFADGFIAKIYNDGIVQDVSMEQLQQYLSNPDNYIKQLENLSKYYYVTSGEVFQVFDLAKVLPTLNYKIEVYDKTKNYEKNLATCNKILNKVRHRQLTRDLISQTISSGTLTGIWLGDKKKPYLFVFDRVDKAPPLYRMNGEWVVGFDLSWLDEMQELERKAYFRNLDPYVTETLYEKYKKDRKDENRYVELPQERSICLRTHTLKRNQQFGLNWSLTGLYDLQHKKKLKDLEKAVANKIISAIAVLTIGSEKNPDQSNLKLNKELKKKIYAGVRQALEKNQSQGVTVVGIPDFAKLEFPEMKGKEVLDPAKFEAITNDLTSAYGTSQALLNGNGSNFASAKINLEVFYKRLAVLLEDIETEVYGKLFSLILPQSVSEDYQLIYDKEAPLSLKDKIDILMKLHSEGFAVKPVIDSLDGVDYSEYIEQSIYEIEILKLREKIIPPMLSYTTSGSEGAGRPEDNNSDNPNTVKSKGNDGNNTPS